MNTTIIAETAVAGLAACALAPYALQAITKLKARTPAKKTDAAPATDADVPAVQTPPAGTSVTALGRTG